MSSQFQAMRHLFQAGLSRRIVLWVFASILLIEGIILLPSIYRRQQELLTHLKNLSKERVDGGLRAINALNTVPPENTVPSETVLLSQLQQIAPNAVVQGGALYRVSGEQVGTFGEAPALTMEQVKGGKTTYYQPASRRYDAVWSMQPLKDYVLIIRHDATSVQRELTAFVIRIALLVMVISIFVTLATLYGLARILITPILTLRNDLLKAGQAIQRDEPHPQFASLRSNRKDELGEVIAAFDQMYRQVSEAISERKQMTSALRQSEEKFSKAFRASPSAILISTLATGRIIEVNDSFLQLYGTTLDEVIGQSALSLNIWTSPQERERVIQQIQQAGAVHNLEYVFRNRQGEPRTILFSAELIRLNQEDCLVAVANDITERKQAEKALERLAEIGELAAMIVHEVRNPLTTVLMGLQSFNSLDLSERWRLRLDLAVEEAHRLQRLLDEILQYTRCQKLQATELETNTLIEEMLESIQAMPAAQGRQIRFEAAPMPVSVLGDRDKLKQVFINLISNACEAVPVGETITWKVDPCPPEKLVCIRIHNGGEPIPADALPRLTQPFFTTKSSGNGLGLAIVRRIIEAHHGELEILSSAEIGGTTVSVVLPLWVNQ